MVWRGMMSVAEFVAGLKHGCRALFLKKFLNLVDRGLTMAA
jgi:hypothetical protein